MGGPPSSPMWNPLVTGWVLRQQHVGTVRALGGNSEKDCHPYFPELLPGQQSSRCPILGWQHSWLIPVWERRPCSTLYPSAPLVAQCLIWLCSAHLATQCTPCTPVLTSPSCSDTVGRPRHWSHLDGVCCPSGPDLGDPGGLEAAF